MNRTRWARFHAGRLLADGHTVYTQRAFVDAVVLRVQARHIERATGDAVTAANALFRLEIDNAVGVLNDRAFSRAGFQAARIRAVHTAIFADQPFQLVVLLHFLEAHHRPRFRGQIGRVVVNPDVAADFIAQIVPLRTGHLAGFAANAGGHVDKFRDLLLVIPRLRRGREAVGSGTADNILRLIAIIRSPLHLFHIDQERLKFRRLRVGITDKWRQGVSDKAFLRHAFITPVNRNTDGVHFLAVHIRAGEYAWSPPLWL